MEYDPLQIWIVALTVLGLFVAFVKEWGKIELVALCGLGVMAVTGILSAEEILGVFSNPAPVTIGAMFVLSAALERTGILESLAEQFSRLAGHSETRALIVLMVTVAVLSAFVNNTPVVVVFMPMVLAYCRSTGVRASHLLIPLSFASMLGGTCTLIGTSTNLLVDGVASKQGVEPFGLFELSKMGIVYALVGITYLMTLGRKLLPNRETLAQLIGSDSSREFLTTAVVENNSPLIGKSILKSPLGKNRRLRVVEVRRLGRRLLTPLDKLKLQARDRLIIKGDAGALKAVREAPGVGLKSRQQLGLTELATEKSILMEGIIGPKSSMIGHTIRDLNFRQKFGVLILAVHRQGENLSRNFENVRLDFGDTLLVEGPRQGIQRIMQEESDFISLTEPETVNFRRSKAPLAILAMALVVALAAFKVMPIAVLAILGAVFVMATRCVEPDEAYKTIDWRILFLIYGMLAVGIGVENSGAADLIAHRSVDLLGGTLGPVLMISLVYLLSVTLTEFISNNASAVLLTPVAIQIALGFGVDPRPFVVAVMFGCSACFATPIGYQTNTYVFGAGGYRFSDFPRVGILLNIILWIAASFLIPIMWPLH